MKQLIVPTGNDAEFYINIASVSVLLPVAIYRRRSVVDKIGNNADINIIIDINKKYVLWNMVSAP